MFDLFAAVVIVLVGCAICIVLGGAFAAVGAIVRAIAGKG